jgi:hypothetical protein
MKFRASVLAILSILWITVSVSAQEETQLSLRLNRDFGTALGGRIQGTFSMRVTGPDELVRVVFFIDDESIGEDNEGPFRMQFRTDSYRPGIHTMRATGYTGSGLELHSNEISRDFMEGGESTQTTIIIVVALLVLVLGGRMLASRIANRGQGVASRPAISGPLGGTICPNCNRPYALHLWGVRLVVVRLDRCPHCGKWRFVRRASPEDLQTAAELLEEEAVADTPAKPISDEDRLRRDLDDSRFDDPT